MKKLILAITLFITSFTYSQIINYEEGVVFYRDGTSEKGLIKRKLYTIKFKNKTTKAKELDYKKIKGIIINEDGYENEYQFKIIKGKKKGNIKLLELVKEGPISIFRIKHTEVAGSLIYNGATYYLSKGNSSKVSLIGSNSIALSRKSVRKGLIKYFKDCPSLLKKLNNKDFTNKDLFKVVDYYNDNCNPN